MTQQPGHEPNPFTAVEATAQRPDYTNYDLSNAPLYHTRDQQAYPAEQLTEDRTIERSWGRQDMHAGDWVVYKRTRGGEVKPSGVMKVAFDATYIPAGNGLYRKDSYIRALLIDHDYQFFGPDSAEVPELAPAGSYFVLNLDRQCQPILKDGRPDIFFYSERDLKDGYYPVDDSGYRAPQAA